MEGFVLGDGRRLAYRELGAGPWVICHPGGPGFSGATLEGLEPAFPGRRLVLLDPRGAGASDPAPSAAAYGLEDYVADVEALRRHLGADAVDFIGHSHGSLVGILYAAMHPERVSRLVLIGTGARFHEEQHAAMEAAMQRRADEPWFADAKAALEAESAGEFSDDAELGKLVARELPFYFASYGERERAFVEAMGERPVHAAALKHFNEDEFRTFDLRPVLGLIRAHTLIIVGAEDFILGPVNAAEVAAGILGSELAAVPGAGHLPWIENPGAFGAAAAGFLET
jgi:proline iminopeptidase